MTPRLRFTGGPAAAGAVAMLALGLLGACGRPAPRVPVSARPTVETVVVDPPREGAVLLVSGAFGRERESALSFRAGGVLAELLVDPGDVVRRGQLIGRLDEAPFRIRLRQTAAELNRATRDADRYGALAANGFISRKQIDDQTTAVVEAQAAHDAAVFEHRWSRLVAPASGVILSRSAQAGEVVQSGQTVVRLADASTGFVLRAPVADRDVTRIRPGAAATLMVDGLPGAPLVGRLVRIGEQVDPRTATVMVEVAAPAAPGLRSGMIGRARIEAAAPPAAQAARVRVPAEAILEIEGVRAVVYRVDAGGVAHRATATFEGFDGDDALLGGLAAGTRLITSGAGFVNDGDRVNTGASAAGGATPGGWR